MSSFAINTTRRKRCFKCDMPESYFCKFAPETNGEDHCLRCSKTLTAKDHRIEELERKLLQANQRFWRMVKRWKILQRQQDETDSDSDSESDDDSDCGSTRKTAVRNRIKRNGKTHNRRNRL